MELKFKTMSDLITLNDVKQGVEALNEKKKQLKELSNEYNTLEIHGIKDKEGYKVVSSAISKLVSERTSIEKTRKDLNVPILAIKRDLDNTAKELTALISPTELKLKGLKSKIDEEKEAEKKRIAEEKMVIYKERLRLISETNPESDGFNYWLEFEDQIVKTNQDEINICVDTHFNNLLDLFETIRGLINKDIKEKEDAENLLLEERKNDLIGLERVHSIHSESQILEHSNESWANEIAILINALNDLKAKEKEDAEKAKKLEEERKVQEQEKLALEKEKEELRRQKEELEAESERLRKEKEDRERIEKERLEKEKQAVEAEKFALEKRQQEERLRKENEEYQKRLSPDKVEIKDYFDSLIVNPYLVSKGEPLQVESFELVEKFNSDLLNLIEDYKKELENL